MGKKAASVFPDAVEAVRRTLSSVPKMGLARGVLYAPQRLPAGAVNIILDKGRVSAENVHRVNSA